MGRRSLLPTSLALVYMQLACIAYGWAIAVGPAVSAEAGDFRVDSSRQIVGRASLTRLQVTLNKSETVHVDEFNDLLVGSPDIIDVVPLSDQEIYVLGKKLGTTNISVLDRDKNLLRLIDVEVKLDTRDIAGKIQAGIGSSTVRVSSRGNKVVLSGTVADAVTVDRAMTIAAALAPQGGAVINAIRVGASQQVMLQVRLLEASRTAGRELGVNLYGAGRSGARGINTGMGSISGAGRFLRDAEGRPVEDNSGNPVSTPGALPLITAAGTLLSGSSPFVTVLANLMRANGTTIDAAITALETRGLARRLAEPNLIALSGDSADFLAGGEFPIPVASTTQGGVPTVTIQFKEFGVRLSFTPTVLANGTINLRLEPEVSEIDRSVSVSTGTVVVPGLAKRRAKTTIELRDGQSFAIAGLLQAVNQNDIDQFPWLGSVPVLGVLFRSTQFQQRETELVVIVTPHLVKPAAPGAAIASPLDGSVPSNDVDRFLFGEQERKKARPAAVEHYQTAAGAVMGPHGHILLAPAAAPQAIVPAPVAVPGAVVRARN